MLRLTALLIALTAPAALAEKTGGPYVPTPQTVVDAMLTFAQVGPRDFVVDLGSGDGRIVLTAARKFNARGFGVDIDRELVDQSNAEARKLGLAERVSFRRQDVLEAKIEEATVLTLYLLPGMMQTLQPKLLRDLKPGTRIVAHDFPLVDWKADRELVVDVPEKYGTPGAWKSTIYYWVVPAKVEGLWDVSAPALQADALAVTLRQQFQFVDGAAQLRGKRLPVSAGRLDGRGIAFTLPLPKGTAEFRGRAEDERMQGEVTQGGRSFTWHAVKVKAATTAAQ